MPNEEILERIQQQLSRMANDLADVKQDVRLAHVRIEAVDSKIDHVVDGVINVEQKLDRFRKETGENFEDLRERVTVLEKTRR